MQMELKFDISKNSLRPLKHIPKTLKYTKTSIFTRVFQFCKKIYKNIHRNTVFEAKIAFFSAKKVSNFFGQYLTKINIIF